MQTTETKCDGCNTSEPAGATYERIRIGTAAPKHVCGLPCRAKVLHQLAEDTDAAHAKAAKKAAAEQPLAEARAKAPTVPVRPDAPAAR